MMVHVFCQVGWPPTGQSSPRKWEILKFNFKERKESLLSTVNELNEPLVKQIECETKKKNMILFC